MNAALPERLNGARMSSRPPDELRAPLGDASRGKGETTFAGASKPSLALRKQLLDFRMQKEPRIAGLHLADDSRVPFLVPDIVLPKRQANRHRMRRIGNRFPQVACVTSRISETRVHHGQAPSTNV